MIEYRLFYSALKFVFYYRLILTSKLKNVICYHHKTCKLRPNISKKIENSSRFYKKQLHKGKQSL